MPKDNQNKYIRTWINEHKKQFKVDLNIDEYNKIDEMLAALKIKKSDFLRNAIKLFKEKQQLVSYECSQIIDDIQTAIAFQDENSECYLIYKNIDGYIIFTDFELENNFELSADEYKIKTDLKSALTIFENQNRII